MSPALGQSTQSLAAYHSSRSVLYRCLRELLLGQRRPDAAQLIAAQLKLCAQFLDEKNPWQAVAQLLQQVDEPQLAQALQQIDAGREPVSSPLSANDLTSVDLNVSARTPYDQLLVLSLLAEHIAEALTNDRLLRGVELNQVQISFVKMNAPSLHRLAQRLVTSENALLVALGEALDCLVRSDEQLLLSEQAARRHSA